MELTEAILSRRMCRRYDPDREVPHATLSRWLELAGRAPSAGFSQGRDFLVLRERSSLDDFWAVSTGDRAEAPRAAPRSARRDAWLLGMRTAPVLVLCLSDPDRYLDRYALPDKSGSRPRAEDWPIPYWDVDTGMAVMILLLGAEDAGLGACFFGIERETEGGLRERFSIPAGRRFVGVVSLGFAAASPEVTASPDLTASRDLTAARDVTPAPDATPAAAGGVSHSRGYRPRKRPLGDYAHAERFGAAWPPAPASDGTAHDA